MTLTVDVNCHVFHRRGWCYYSAIFLLLRTGPVDAHSSIRAITFFALDTIALLIPPSTMLDNVDTDVLPFGASFIAFNTLAHGCVPIFTERVKISMGQEVALMEKPG